MANAKKDDIVRLLNPGGDLLNGRYEIQDLLGKGGFGKIFRIKDCKLHQYLALKVYTEESAGYKEILMLEFVQSYDLDEKRLCIKMHESFKVKGFICIILELLGCSIYDFLVQNNYCAYSIDEVRCLAYQVCQAVKYLHDVELLHGDIKPHNILFESSEFRITVSDRYGGLVKTIKDLDIRLIDFGFASNVHGEKRKCTKVYRCLEMVLDLEWSKPADVFAIGCTLFQCYKGHQLFRANSVQEHLAIMNRILGPIPVSIAKISKSPYFNDEGKLILNYEQSSAAYLKKYKPLTSYLEEFTDDHTQFFDLLLKMLKYEDRITAKEALEHPFFDKVPDHFKIDDELSSTSSLENELD